MNDIRVAAELAEITAMLADVAQDDIQVPMQQLNLVIDSFIKYILGDKKQAISKLQSLHYTPKNLPAMDTKEYNEMYGDLFYAVRKSIRMNFGYKKEE